MMDYEIWLITGSQHLYGEETLKQVEKDSKIIANELTASDIIPFKVIYKPVLTTPESITNICLEANHWNNYLDAYILTCKNVDCRSENTHKTIFAFTYPVQP